jgi:hypothetical protein
VYPPYSFIQAGDPTTQGCTADPLFCLPLSDPSHLIFQVQMYNLGTIPANYNLFAVPVPCDAACVDSWEEPPPAHSITGGTIYPALISLLPYALIYSEHYDPPYPADPYTVFFDTVPSVTTSGSDFVATFDARSTLPVPNTLGGYSIGSIPPVVPSDPANILTTIDVGQCFKLQYIYEVYGTSRSDVLFRHYIGGGTNCFVRTTQDECFTSVVKYINSSSVFGFDYGYNIPNIVELPMYLRDPLMENDQKVYTKSDGSLVKLYERKEEIYMLETDLMPYIWHKDLDVALSHDTVTITNPNLSAFDPLNTAAQFVKKENYAIEYQKAPLSALGKATCKLSNAMPVLLINNNCG